ncbi:uncharacterized protein [Physeter macrocephalus]|uniref:Uncharacterized protein n=1 Tax=Physeter macrocephalus TaxID=9755 RepID=A0A455B3A4_PHYMC|nr:uncharacterized protein LOC114485799 [Physeter catodon]|eukprot:XP_028343405.1 uncharacterized protein LOC114485799 [Physeter catodon]
MSMLTNTKLYIRRTAYQAYVETPRTLNCIYGRTSLVSRATRPHENLDYHFGGRLHRNDSVFCQKCLQSRGAQLWLEARKYYVILLPEATLLPKVLDFLASRRDHTRKFSTYAYDAAAAVGAGHGPAWARGSLLLRRTAETEASSTVYLPYPHKMETEDATNVKYFPRAFTAPTPPCPSLVTAEDVCLYATLKQALPTCSSSHRKNSCRRGDLLQAVPDLREVNNCEADAGGAATGLRNQAKKKQKKQHFCCGLCDD